MKKTAPSWGGFFVVFGLPEGKKHEAFNVVKSEENLFQNQSKIDF